MKITVEIDCTPEEARRAMGLPDVAAWQDAALARMAEGEGFRPEVMEAMLKSWAPMSDAGLGLWRAMMDAATPRPEPTR